jgi:hypothetical protein
MSLRPEEQFVISALATKYSAEWRPGDNPPDAQLIFGKETVAVEISMLTQQIVDGDGKFIPRQSQDAEPLRIIEELNDELSAQVPPNITVFIHIKAPISQRRKLKNSLSERIEGLLTGETEIQPDAFSNRTLIKLLPTERPSGKKIVGCVSNSKSDSNILANAWHMLDERIATKAYKCKALRANGPIWLALLNDYWLADEETYKQAMRMSTTAHYFDKILLVCGNKSVVSLYGK